ncbi:MAG TPA: cytochrome d ubiquinol oxidase subunit II [Candidatus Dormibacteraeota bacterium]|nr:cytochrome d ubiquinol oxidase subunit II [Candidatus Dormibacteraeota bacterium]
METLWFMIVAVMVAAYVVLDGFDLGAGVIYLGAARTPAERQKIMRAIGPVWDGNEVWLLAAGGTLYFAFPLLYASSFSGFYLPLMMVLWLLMLRGIGIELRAHMENPVWRGFFDVVFCVASILLCIFFGAALGNVVRGVPLAADQYFFEPLWTNFRVNSGTAGTSNGILDWYTVLTGVIALVTLTAHGSLYVAIKTEDDLNRRARAVAKAAWPVQLLLTIVGLVATVSIRPGVLENYKHHAIGFVIPVLVFGALAVMMHAMLKQSDKMAFVASALYIVGMLVGAAFALYPVVLPASTDPALNLTIYNTAAGHHGLTVGFTWWILGMVLALGYFFFLFRMFKGKVRLDGEGY